MGRHSASHIAAKYVGGVGALALAIGVGAAVAGGAGAANAETPANSVGGAGAASSPKPKAEAADHGPGVTPDKPGLLRPTPRQPKTVAMTKHTVSKADSATPKAPTAVTTPGGGPSGPLETVLGSLQLIRREIEHIFVREVPSTAAVTSAQAYAAAHPAVTTGTPTLADEVPTAYGDIGKWMLQPNGQLSNYGGQTYGGKTMLEPINVIIVDPTSTTAAEATGRLNTAMFWSGFPAQFIHSSGFLGTIDGTTYGQQPGFLQGYSDNFFLFPDDHGRMFGPNPVATGAGYVWSGTFSSETLGFSGLPGHIYVSSEAARTALAMGLVASGQATFVGMVPLDNAANTATYTTGDHDGYAVVLQLT